jgi:hypothetical protein
MFKIVNNFFFLFEINSILRLTSRSFYARSQVAGFENFKIQRLKWQQKYTFAQTLSEYERVDNIETSSSTKLIKILETRLKKYTLNKLTWLVQEECHLDACVEFCKKNSLNKLIGFGDLFAKTCVLLNRMDKLMAAFYDLVSLKKRKKLFIYYIILNYLK